VVLAGLIDRDVIALVAQGFAQSLNCRSVSLVGLTNEIRQSRISQKNSVAKREIEDVLSLVRDGEDFHEEKLEFQSG
jgi:hypothetical protein